MSRKQTLKVAVKTVDIVFTTKIGSLIDILLCWYGFADYQITEPITTDIREREENEIIPSSSSKSCSGETSPPDALYDLNLSTYMSCDDESAETNWFQVNLDSVHCIAEVEWFDYTPGFTIATFNDNGSGMECSGTNYLCERLTLTISTEGADEIDSREGATCVFGNRVKVALQTMPSGFEVYDMAVIEGSGEFSVC